jgi:isoamylase
MSGRFEVWPGVAYPLGATYDGQGVNFAVFSEHATKVEVCLFAEEKPTYEVARLALHDHTNHVFHGFVPHVRAGALYGYRVHGPWAPERGMRFNPHKLLVDPYARAISGKPDWSAPLVGHTAVDGRELMDTRDDAHGVPRSVVVHDEFDWQGDRRPEVIWRRAIIYELHVKGFTALHPGVPPELRGTYAGLAHPAVIDHLVKLGITSVELLPVHEAVSEGFLQQRGLTNYWGYNTLGFFAPDQRFSSRGSHGQQVREFKEMVKALHRAGLEVILDVVYNHTCEGNHLGPTLCYRGLDNATYYWHEGSDPARNRDFTGCGNSLDCSHPQVVKLVLDSLRYWVTEMHVDGFRFDLATTLARTRGGDFDARSAFLSALHQDPILSRVKLISEPWDVGYGGYKLGNFPVLFAEWNDRYRQTVRRFWRGDGGQVADLGYRVTGSSDYFRSSGRRPTSSLNFVACHDGFPLGDVVRYSRKHNDANKEDNRDGSDENHSASWGAEGPTDDPLIEGLRDRLLRDFIATLFLSVGTPMLLAGDEFGRSQKGNNNAYCQDNALSYIEWNLGPRQRSLYEFTRRCIALRQSQPVLQRRNFFLGATLEDSRFRDLVWFRTDGKELDRGDWENSELRCLGMFLGGDAIATRDPRGKKIVGDTLLVYFNASSQALLVTLPGPAWGESWELILETAHASPRSVSAKAAEVLPLPPHSVVVMRQRTHLG